MSCTARDHKQSTPLHTLASRTMNFLPKILIVLAAIAASAIASPAPHVIGAIVLPRSPTTPLAARAGGLRQNQAPGQYHPTLMSNLHR